MEGFDFGAYSRGFAMSAGLIMAIGAQNVFVLTQGARRQRQWLVAGCCTLCDILLIALGVCGGGALAAASPMASALLGLAGAGFLAVYGALACRSALRSGGEGLLPGGEAPSARAVLATTLAVSLLNPHALLDTIVLIGGMAGSLPAGARAAFGMGAATASACWFFSLSLGGRALAPVLRRRSAWRVLDVCVCATMWALAADIGRGALEGLGRLG
jgi:L-lysine exporter family protein LysE/ArgO